MGLGVGYETTNPIQCYEGATQPGDVLDVEETV